MSAAERRVWEAEEADLDQVAALLGEFRESFGDPAPDLARMRASAARIRAGGDGVFLLGALGGGAAEGVCQVRFRASVWSDGDDAWLEDLFVRRRARHRGLARALATTAIEHSLARGCARIELDVDESNLPALGLYRSLGFAGDLKAHRRSLLLGLRLEERDQAAPRSAASRADSSA